MANVKIYTTDSCPYCRKAKNILESKNVEYEEVNIHGSEKRRDEIKDLTGRRDVPQIFINDEHIGDDDALEEICVSGELDKMLGNEPEEPNNTIEEQDLVIIGAGPAGLAAGLYGARADLEPLIIGSSQIGGQLSLTDKIENYPGFDGKDAMSLIRTMQQQAEKFGSEIEYKMVNEVNFACHPFWLKTSNKEYSAKSVIICTGSSFRKLDVKGETKYTGRGVSYCATCDGFFFKDLPVVVVGGGNTAVEEALFLTKFASEVYIIHRRDRLRANETLQERAFENKKVNFIWDSVVKEIQGDGNNVTSVLLENVKTGEETIHPTEGVFVFVGYVPNTEIFKGQVELDEQGCIVTDKQQHTSIRGVFAAGDVQDPIFRQAVISAGTGAAAAIEAEKFVAEIEGRAYPGK